MTQLVYQEKHFDRARVNAAERSPASLRTQNRRKQENRYILSCPLQDRVVKRVLAVPVRRQAVAPSTPMDIPGAGEGCRKEEEKCFWGGGRAWGMAS